MKKLVFSIALFCGMMVNAQQLLEVLKPFPENNGGGGGNPPYFRMNNWNCVPGGIVKVTLITPDGRYEYEQDGFETISEAAMYKGINIPYGNGSGTEASSAARVVSGNVNNEAQRYLKTNQLDMGYILLDTSYPCTDVVIETEKSEEVMRDHD